jgi:hypothetical protein
VGLISVLAQRAVWGERGVSAPRGRAGENGHRPSLDARSGALTKAIG